MANTLFTPDSQTLAKRYFAAPNSMDPLSPVYRAGLIPLGIFALMSLLSVTVLLGFITQQMISWRKHYRQYVGYSQYIILIYNLLLADLQQSIAFSISFHWLKMDKILAPSRACFIQGWFLQIGDVSSGLFVLAIAIHTWLGVVKGYKMSHMWFVMAILALWFFALTLTFLGPVMYQDRYFARAAGWCWVSHDYQNERLWLHYLWIFIVEFGTIIIYAHIFFHLRGRIRTIMANDTSKLTRATKFMVMYPAVYVILTLPIAVGRMVAMTGQTMPDLFYVIVGCLLTSCGWIDALLYTLTRRVLVSGDSSLGQSNETVTALTNITRPGDGDYGLQAMGAKEHITTARTVTITGGSNRLYRLAEHWHGRSQLRRSCHEETCHKDESPTRSGSQDFIIKSPHTGRGINIVTETSVQVETTDDKDFEAGTPSSKDWSEDSIHTT